MSDRRSCYYEGIVVHRRHTPIERTFRYPLFMVYVDLAELDELFGRRGLWSTRFPAVARFRRSDYFGDRSVPLDEAVRTLVSDRTGRRPTGPIRLLTNFRYFGFGMNPVSFYFCHDADERLETLVAEVTNTPWNERHCYVVPLPRDDSQAERRLPSVEKQLHVSPFLHSNMSYRWRVTPPDERLTIGIENHDAAGIPFQAKLALRRVPLSPAARRKMLVRYPLLTLRIFVHIYYQAWQIRRAGVPFVPHPGTASNITLTDPLETDDRVTV